jgi:hypothetical protein
MDAVSEGYGKSNGLELENTRGKLGKRSTGNGATIRGRIQEQRRAETRER